ncbi:hypothetical protein [Streptomyces sp. NBC_01602]
MTAASRTSDGPLAAHASWDGPWRRTSSTRTPTRSAVTIPSAEIIAT